MRQLTDIREKYLLIFLYYTQYGSMPGLQGSGQWLQGRVLAYMLFCKFPGHLGKMSRLFKVAVRNFFYKLDKEIGAPLCGKRSRRNFEHPLCFVQLFCYTVHIKPLRLTGSLQWPAAATAVADAIAAKQHGCPVA